MQPHCTYQSIVPVGEPAPPASPPPRPAPRASRLRAPLAASGLAALLLLCFAARAPASFGTPNLPEHPFRPAIPAARAPAPAPAADALARRARRLSNQFLTARNASRPPPVRAFYTYTRARVATRACPERLRCSAVLLAEESRRGLVLYAGYVIEPDGPAFAEVTAATRGEVAATTAEDAAEFAVPLVDSVESDFGPEPCGLSVEAVSSALLQAAEAAAACVHTRDPRCVSHDIVAMC